MKRKQIYIDEAADRALKHLSTRSGRSEAAHIRDALDSYLAEHVPATEDPMAALVGMIEDRDGPDDVAARHDDYLYEAAESPNRYEA